jgi:hypothetical protein
VVLARERLPQRGGQARLADAGLAAQQHDLALAPAGPAPAAEQQLQLLPTSDKRQVHRGGAQRLEAALDAALAQRAPRAHRPGQPLQFRPTEVGPREQRPRQPACGRVRHHRARLGEPLQPRRHVRRLAHHAALARLRARAQHLAHHHRPGGDPDARGQRPGPGRLQPRHSLRRGQAHAHGALGVVLARLRPAEVGEHAVAEQLGHVAALRPTRRSAARW